MGYLSAGYLASLVFDLVRGAPLVEAMLAADGRLAREPKGEELAGWIGKVRVLEATGTPDAATIERLGGGWTGEEALAIALLCALTADATSPDGIAAALWRAAAHSGDSDSTAAICGNILGAIAGVEGLPAHWIEQVELSDLVDRLATDLFAIGVENKQLDHDDYPPN
jgi:ADP-ribosylglycohydrolase